VLQVNVLQVSVLQVSVKFSVKPALEFRVWFKPNTSGRLKAGPFFSSDESKAKPRNVRALRCPSCRC
jgi:hypothetical protein